jgi:TRAP-type C4-dicarboxylate transport system permease small subunit
MKSKYKFKKILDVIYRIETFLMMIFLAIILGIGALEIVSRVLFRNSFLWIYPISLLLFGWMVFIGIAVVFYRKEYITVELFVRLLPSNYQRYVNIVANFAVMGFFIFLLIEAPALIEMQAQKMQIIHIPRYLQSLPLFIGSFSVLLCVFYDTLILMKGYTDK